MTEQEWLKIGIDNGVIDIQEQTKERFERVFMDWFKMKKNIVRPQSLDRIEVTYNKYYAFTALEEMFVQDITDNDIIDFLTSIIVKNGNITYKELGRILQIVNNVLVYAKDLNYTGVPLHDWDKIKRYLPIDKLDTSIKKEYCISPKDINTLIDCVVNHNIYPVKHNASLLLCMNFYLGLRVGELASLTFDDFDFDRGVVKIYKTESKFYNRSEDGSKLGVMVYRVVDDVKTVHSVRELPILPEVKHIYDLIKVNHRLNNYESPYLAYDGNDTIIVRSLDRTLRRLCQLCDIPYFNTHAIRKSFATRLHYSNVPTRVISDLLGHSEIGTTENSYILSYNQNYDDILKYMKDGLRYE